MWIVYTEMIMQKQVEILIQLQKVFGPNMLDDLLAKIIGSQNMQTVLILSHIFFRFLTFLLKFYFQQTWKSQQEVSGLRALLIDGTSSFLFNNIQIFVGLCLLEFDEFLDHFDRSSILVNDVLSPH